MGAASSESGFAWTARQFVGGDPALDLLNTIVYRDDPARRFDRLANEAAAAAWLAAARRFASPGLPTGPAGLRALREAVDGVVARGDPAARGHLLAHVGAAMLDAPASAAAAIGEGFVALLYSRDFERMKQCPNCHWFFIDRTRNGSRRWCDMATCGNGEKAAKRRDRRKRR
ncbi:MAG: CGNR zinc finger domain-containing protein [Flavobacteriaceae bacterium]